MRIGIAAFLVVGLSIAGFCFALFGEPRSEGDTILAIERAHEAGDSFTVAWNDWAEHHNLFQTSVEDKARFRKVRARWKEFERLYREIE